MVRLLALMSLVFFAVLSARGDDVTIYRPQPPPFHPTTPQPGHPAVAGGDRTYTVKRGDTLWSIAQRHQCTIQAIRLQNNLPPTGIQPGMVIHLPPQQVQKTTTVGAPSSAQAEPKKEPQLELQRKFVAETKMIAEHGVGYDGRWEGWMMDCSNTVRYLYKKVAGVELDRTASDQYFTLEQKGRAWAAPRDEKGETDLAALSERLRIGDLLFWENTCRPHRDPPITHVMIYLGQNKEKEWLMAGSQEGSGFFNVAGSGPDIYKFNPTASVGGYRKNLWFTKVRGRFVAYGRPLTGTESVTLVDR